MALMMAERDQFYADHPAPEPLNENLNALKSFRQEQEPNHMPDVKIEDMD